MTGSTTGTGTFPFFLSTPDLPIFSRYVYGSAYFMNYLSETYGTDVTRRIWLAARTRTTADAVRSVAFGGSWEAMKLFAPAEYLLGISDFTTDAASLIPLPNNRIRATHSSYPVEVSVTASTKKVANLAPWGLGANFVEFVPGGARGTLTLSFRRRGRICVASAGGAHAVEWRRIQCRAGHAQLRQRRLDQHRRIRYPLEQGDADADHRRRERRRGAVHVWSDDSVDRRETSGHLNAPGGPGAFEESRKRTLRDRWARRFPTASHQGRPFTWKSRPGRAPDRPVTQALRRASTGSGSVAADCR